MAAIQSRKTRILLGATGSVASIKIPQLVQLLQKDPTVEVKVVATEAALHFFKKEEISAIVYTDADEWQMWGKRTDPVLHIELRKWADMFVIAPLDANTLAKTASGLCDNLLTSVLRAWDSSRPVIICPAMNTNMWDHPFTAAHLKLVQDMLKYRVIAPIGKLLACGDIGMGAMAEPETIAEQALDVAKMVILSTESNIFDQN